MASSVESPPCGNPYRQLRPRGPQVLMQGKFYPANEKGNYDLHAKPIELILCRDYLWVGDVLTIPLATITDTRLSKHGGTICFWDAVAGAEMAFHFTKVGFLRFRRRDVELLLGRIAQLRLEGLPRVDARGAVAVPAPLAASSATTAPLEFACEHCGAKDVEIYEFVVFKFVGLVLVAYSYSVTPLRHVLCAKHAGSGALRCCLRTLAGYLGFPGFLAAPWYVVKNLLELKRHKQADFQTVGLVVLLTIILPCSLIAVLILAIVQAAD